jgi:hypothetical protein
MRQASCLHGLELDSLLLGIAVNTSPTNFSPIDQMQLMQFKGERWELFGSLQKGGHRN